MRFKDLLDNTNVDDQEPASMRRHRRRFVEREQDRLIQEEMKDIEETNFIPCPNCGNRVLSKRMAYCPCCGKENEQFSLLEYEAIFPVECHSIFDHPRELCNQNLHDFLIADSAEMFAKDPERDRFRYCDSCGLKLVD